MFFEKKFTKQSIYLNRIPKILPIDFDRLKKEIKKYHNKKFKKSNTDFSPFFNYYHIPDTIDIIWIRDYIKDFFDLKTKKTLVHKKTCFLWMKKNEYINSHQHIDLYDIEESPDFSFIVCVSCGNNYPKYIEYEYECGRKKHGKYRQYYQEKSIIGFNSELMHSFSKNLNKEETINLSFRFQII